MTGDVFGSVKCDCGRQLQAAMRLIGDEGCGVIVYQQQEGRGIGIINKIRAYALQDAGADTIEANQRLGLEVDLRQYEQCAEILLDLGLGQVRVLSNNPEKIRALKAAGLEVVARVALEPAPTDREDRLPYDRPNLSKDYLQGHAEPEWMPLRPAEFFTDHDIEVMRGAAR
jgi:3,4-dihydroxy 2-butanone 4-phosphate synthase/GTP cyclohydrolase II